MRRPSNWLQIGANAGILAGLILVGIQIMQSNAIAAAQVFQSNVESTMSYELALVGENADVSMRRVLFEPELASRDDYYVADRIYAVIGRQLTIAHAFSDQGLYGNAPGISPAGFVRVNFRLFACPYGLASLDQALSGIPPSNFRESVELMRELASDRSEATNMAARIQRADVLLKQIQNSKGEAEAVGDGS